MNDMNDQMMNFRKSLGLDELESAQVVKEKSGRDGIAGRARNDVVQHDAVQVAAKREVRRNPGETEKVSLAGGRTTITIPAELLGKMKLLSFWMTREGMSRNMSMSQMVWEMFECYLDSFEGARGFVEKNVD